MTKLLTFYLKYAAIASLFLLYNCTDPDTTAVDDRFLWVGYYEVAETVQDPITGYSSTVYYDLSIQKAWGSNAKVELKGVTSGIYGTSCVLIGDVFRPEELSIPLFICQLGPDEYLEIRGVGRIRQDGCCAQIELTIDYCHAGFCQSKPPVLLELQKR